MRDPYNRVPMRRSNGVLRTSLIAIVAFILISVGGVAFRFLSAPQPPAPAPRNFDREILSDPQYGAAFVKMKTLFPDEYAAMMAESERAYQSGAGPNVAGEISRDAVNRLMRQHVHDLVSAPTDSLQTYRALQLDTVIHLQKSSEEACAAAFMNSRSFHSDDPVVVADEAKVFSALLDAIVAGRDHPTARSAMTPAEKLTWFRQMQREGLTRSQAMRLGNDAGLSTATVHDQCMILVIMVKSINDLPPSVADKATVMQFTAGYGHANAY